MREQHVAPAFGTPAQTVENDRLARIEAASIDHHIQGPVAGFQVADEDAPRERLEFCLIAAAVTSGRSCGPEARQQFAAQDLLDQWSNPLPVTSRFQLASRRWGRALPQHSRPAFQTAL